MKKKKLDIGEADAEKTEVGPLLAKERLEKLAARIMELGPYELATLAARICPELCLKSPVEAIGKAQRLLMAVQLEDMQADAPLVAAMKDRETEKLAASRLDFREGVKRITGVERRGTGRFSALTWFQRFLEVKDRRKWKALLEIYRRNGFTELEKQKLREEFDDWRRPRKKGTQGRRRSKYDKRVVVRDDRGVALMTAPTQTLVLTKADKVELHKAAVKHGWKEKLDDGDFATRRTIKHCQRDERGWGEHHKVTQLPGVRRPRPKASRHG